MKTGWKTTEFWLSLATQALALLAVLGFINGSDSKTLEDALGKCIAAIFLFLTNAQIVISYIKSRMVLKLPEYDVPPMVNEPKPEPAKDPFLPPIILILAALFLFPFSLEAAQPFPTQSTGLFNGGWRKQTEKRLDDHNRLIGELIQGQRQQHSPQQPIIIMPPLQQLPIGGHPQQQLPIPGQPQQLLPIPGQPIQPLPIQGQPIQPLPIGGQPQQQLPIQPPNIQQQPQAYSNWMRAIGRPE